MLKYLTILALIASDNLQSMEGPSLTQEQRAEITKKFIQEPDVLLAEVQDEMHPLFGLSECIAAQCTLARQKYPHVRSFFTQNVVDNLIERHPNKDLPLGLAFIGAGALFTETEILTRLIDKSYHNFVIAIIDPHPNQQSIAALLNWLKSHQSTPTYQIFNSIEEYLASPQENIKNFFAIDPYEGIATQEIERSLEVLKNWLPENSQLTLLLKHTPAKIDPYIAKIVRYTKRANFLEEETIKILRKKPSSN